MDVFPRCVPPIYVFSSLGFSSLPYGTYGNRKENIIAAPIGPYREYK